MKKCCFNRIEFLTIIFMLFTSCGIKQEKIAYGEDGCHYCSMTIVDKIHGAEIITNTGKVYKFDAVECMVNYTKDVDKDKIARYLCNHYENPEDLIDATKATFLISKNIRSPMGAYLTAFENQASAEKARAEKEGDIYNWEQLLKHLKH